MKLFLLPGLLGLLLTLNGCAKTVKAPETTEPQNQVSETKTDEAFLTADYVGMSEAEAQAHARAQNEPFRVVERDGQPLPVTMDYRVGRINAVVEDGVVVSYTVEGQEENLSPPEPPSYDQTSWQTMIAESCTSFFDGCNTCRRMPGEAMAACTRRFCETYEKPRCLEDSDSSNVTGASGFGGRGAAYVCDDENTFKVSYEQYLGPDGVVRLDANQIMFEEAQTSEKMILSRTVSASGEKYESSTGLTFWNKGNNAVVLTGEDLLYENCEEI